MKLILVIICLLLTGCETTGAGANVRWYNPGTWFSGSAGRDAAKTEAKLGGAKDAAVLSAQKSAHETQVALLTAPTSRQADVAAASNDNTVALLDQVAGPLTASDIASIKEKIRLLTSDLADERARGESMRANDQKKDDKISTLIGELNAAKLENDRKLAEAFTRENGLANELRNERWWSWFWRITIGATALIAAAAYLYLRFTIGGLPTALGKSLNSLRASSPDIADAIVGHLDIHTSPAEQQLIALMSARHK